MRWRTGIAPLFGGLLGCGALLSAPVAVAQYGHFDAPPAPPSAAGQAEMPPPVGVETAVNPPAQDEVGLASTASAPALIVEDAAEAAMVVVTGFHQALRENDRAAALAALAPELSVIDNGRVARHREAYAAQWLEGDLQAARAGSRERLDREVFTAGDLAWILSQWRLPGAAAVGGTGFVDLAETAVLQRFTQGWLIVHLHRSTQPAIPSAAP